MSKTEEKPEAEETPSAVKNEETESEIMCKTEEKPEAEEAPSEETESEIIPKTEEKPEAEETPSAVKNEETEPESDSVVKCEIKLDMRDVPNGTGGLKENDKLDVKTESDVRDLVEQPENDGTCDQKEILDGKPEMNKPEMAVTETQKSDVHKDLMEPKEIETENDGKPKMNKPEMDVTETQKSDVHKDLMEPKEIEMENDGKPKINKPEMDVMETQKSDVHKDLMEPKEIETESNGESSESYESYQLEIENCGKHSAEYSHDGSFEGFDASGLMPTLCTDDESADRWV